MDDKKISEAEALQAMKDTNGWKILEGVIRGSRDAAMTNMLNPEKTGKWEDFVHYRATHNAYAKLLTLLDSKIERGITAKNRKEKTNG